MPPFRPLVRNFSRPAATGTNPYLVSMIAGPNSTSASVAAKKAFSTSSVRASGGETHYEPPHGWLWGIPPGEKYKKEGWENIWVFGFWGSLAVAVVAYAYKPDSSIQTWALEEARRRLEAEGILAEPETAGNPVKSN